MSDLSIGTGGVEALAEASSDSLSELFSRDPEGYSQQDLAKIVSVLREQRVRWAATEAEKPAKGTRSAKAPAGPKATSTVVAAEDLGL